MYEKIKEISKLIEALYLQGKTIETFLNVFEIQAPLEGKIVKEGEDLSKAIEFIKSEEFAKKFEKDFENFSIEEMQYLADYYRSAACSKFSDKLATSLYSEIKAQFLAESDSAPKGGTE